MADGNDDQEGERKAALKRRAIAAMEFVRWAAKEQSSLVRWGPHAKDQMADREIFVRDIEAVLKLGDITGDPKEGENEGEISIDISYRPKGMREIVVATIVVKELKKIFLKTVMWKDER